MDSFVAARIGAPFGLKGQLKAASLSGETEHLKTLDRVFLRKDGQTRSYDIEAAEDVFGGLLIKFRGIDTPEQAGSLRGAEFLVERSQAAVLTEDEYYIADLRGLDVVLNGQAIGVVNDVIDGGGGQLVELCLLNGDTRLVPFRNEFFGEIDLAGKKATLLVDWILE